MSVDSTQELRPKLMLPGFILAVLAHAVFDTGGWGEFIPLLFMQHPITLRLVSLSLEPLPQHSSAGLPSCLSSPLFRLCHWHWAGLAKRKMQHARQTRSLGFSVHHSMWYRMELRITWSIHLRALHNGDRHSGAHISWTRLRVVGMIALALKTAETDMIDWHVHFRVTSAEEQEILQILQPGRKMGEAMSKTTTAEAVVVQCTLQCVSLQGL